MKQYERGALLSTALIARPSARTTRVRNAVIAWLRAE